jgi:hypothetical protein
VAFSQLHLTPFDHYESAWRTENTGSNPHWRIESVSGAALVEDRGGYDPVAEHVAQAVETLTTGRVNGLRSIAKAVLA